MQVTKYSANGNDFVVMIEQEHNNRSQLAKKLCHRQNGVGADGLVVVLPHKEYDFEWEFYNSDGSLASMCGNASRAVAHFAHEKGISQDGTSEFLTGAGVIRATINGNYVVSDMTPPKIVRDDIEEDGENWWLIDTGVPHLVTLRDDISYIDIEQLRALREKYNCNVNVCKVEDDSILRVRTYERGVENETLACGTGMVACFVRSNSQKLIKDEVKVFPTSNDELYVSKVEDTYKFGGQVTKTFVAETFIYAIIKKTYVTIMLHYAKLKEQGEVMKKLGVLSLVAAAFLTQGCVTNQEAQQLIANKLSEIAKSVDRKMSKVDSTISKRLSRVENSVDTRLTQVENTVNERLTQVEESVNGRVSSLESQIASKDKVVSQPAANNKEYSIETNVSSTINDTVHQISEQLLATFDNQENQAIAITSFVDLHNLEKTTHFGRVVAESFFNELNTRNLNVIDLRAQKALSVTDNGEFFLSRDVKKLKTKIINKYVLVGTYSKVAEGVIINSRIISNETGEVIASSRVIFHSDDCELFENCVEPEPIEIIPASTIEVVAG